MLQAKIFDLWIRRNTGTAVCTVAEGTPTDNQYAQFATTASFAYALQPIGSQINEGIVRVSADMLSPTDWTHSTRVSRVALGDDSFYAGAPHFYRETASWFGFGQTGGNNRFNVVNGNGEGGITALWGTVEVKTENWYRFVADLDLYSNTYSVHVYDLGTDHPTLDTATPASAVESFSNLGFRRNLGDTSSDLNGITTVGIASFGNASAMGFDNIVIAEHSLSPHAQQILSTQPAIYWRLEEPTGSTTAVDSAMGAPYNGSYEGNYTLEKPGPRPSDGLFGMDVNNRAVEVDGAGSSKVRYTDLSGADVPTGSYSYQMWFKSTASSWTDCTLQYLFQRGNDDTSDGRRDAVYVGGSFQNLNPGKLAFVSGDGSTTWGEQVLELEQWYHLTFVRDDDATGSKVQVYLNGELEISSDSAWHGGLGNHLAAGNRTDVVASHDLGLHGLFDEVAVWDRALSAAEVRANYVSAVPEPSAWMLLLLAGLSAASCRRRKPCPASDI